MSKKTDKPKKEEKKVEKKEVKKEKDTKVELVVSGGEEKLKTTFPDGSVRLQFL